jgi:hypothetical protein
MQSPTRADCGRVWRRSARRQLRREDGQAFVLSFLFLTVLLGLSAGVLDVGVWYQHQRNLQARVDAAALAGAQALPDDPAAARALAATYGAKNGGLFDATVQVNRGFGEHDTIRVEAIRPSPGFLTRIVGIDSIKVRAVAAARGGMPEEVRGAAPIGVDEKHPLLQCKPSPCFEQPTELALDKVGPGAFRLVNIDGSRGGTGPPILADWIERGYQGFMPLGWYHSDPGAKFNSSHVKGALDSRIGTEMLYPVYRSTRGQGANFEYEVVAWVGYYLTGYEIQGSKNNKLFGWFTRVIWEGIMSESSNGTDFGVRVVSLVE